MATSAASASDTMRTSGVDVVMVAERAVDQKILDLRGELGVKFHEIENGESGIQNIISKVKDLEEYFEHLNDLSLIHI